MLYEGELVAYGNLREIHCNGKKYTLKKNGIYRTYPEHRNRKRLDDPTAFRKIIEYLKTE